MPDCPSLDSLISRQSEAAVKQHLSECAHCRTELALFQDFEAAEPGPAETAGLAWVEAELSQRFPAAAKPRLGDWFRLWFTPARLSLAGAALVVLLAAGLFVRSGPRVQPATDAPVVWRSVDFRAIAPAGDLEAAPSQLAWEGVAGAASYHVRLLEVDGTQVWSGDTAASAIALPASIEAQLIPGRAFQWDAAAFDSAGHRIAATNLQSFHIPATLR